MDAHAKEQGARSLQETKRAAAAKEHFEDKELFVTVQFNGDGLPRHGFDVPDTRNLLDLAPVVTELLKRPTEDHPFVEFYIEGAPSELNGLKSLRRIMEDLQHSPELPLKLDVTIRELPAVLLRARNAIKTEKELERELHEMREEQKVLEVQLEIARAVPQLSGSPAEAEGLRTASASGSKRPGGSKKKTKRKSRGTNRSRKRK